MAILLEEDWEGESDATAMTTSTTAFNGTYLGSGASTHSTDTANEGSLSGKFVCSSASRIVGGTHTAVGAVWHVFDFRYTATPGSNCVIFKPYDSATALGEIRLLTTGVLQIRDGTTARGSNSPVLSVNTWYRIAAYFDPSGNRCRLKVYNDPDSTGAADFDTGSQTFSNVSATTTNELFLGVHSNVTLTCYFDRYKSNDDGTEWAPSGSGNATYDLSATYYTDTTDVDEWVLDATGSTGTTSLTQTAGTSVGTITESPTGVFTFSNPAGSDRLTFDLDADTDALEVNIWRRTRPTTLTLIGGVWQ